MSPFEPITSADNSGYLITIIKIFEDLTGKKC